MRRAAWRRAVSVGLVSVLAACSGSGVRVATGTTAVPSDSLSGTTADTTTGTETVITGPATVGAVQTLTGKEALYGASPTRNGPIVYQPDVVLVGGGANAVKSVSSDGLVWTIDGTAPHADEIQPGKVLFASSFGAGRVLGVDQVGPDKRVALGPVALTDLIKDGSFATTTPVPLTHALAYSVPGRPGLETAIDNTPSAVTTGGSAPPDSSAGFRSAGFGSPHPVRIPTLPPLPPPSPDIPQSEVGSWNLSPVCCSPSACTSRTTRTALACRPTRT